jgi:hypothetical protein
MDRNSNITHDGLPEFNGKMPHSVPEGYFDLLAGSVLQLVKEQEDTVNDLPEIALPYAVPQGYFEALPSVLRNRIDESETKIYETRLPGRQWVAAAVIVLAIGIGGGLMWGAGQSETERLLAAVPQATLGDYIQKSYGLDPGIVLQNTRVEHLDVKESDIEVYLNETGWE